MSTAVPSSAGTRRKISRTGDLTVGIGAGGAVESAAVRAGACATALLCPARDAPGASRTNEASPSALVAWFGSTVRSAGESGWCLGRTAPVFSLASVASFRFGGKAPGRLVRRVDSDGCAVFSDRRVGEGRLSGFSGTGCKFPSAARGLPAPSVLRAAGCRPSGRPMLPAVASGALPRMVGDAGVGPAVAAAAVATARVSAACTFRGAIRRANAIPARADCAGTFVRAALGSTSAGPVSASADSGMPVTSGIGAETTPADSAPVPGRLTRAPVSDAATPVCHC